MAAVTSGRLGADTTTASTTATSWLRTVRASGPVIRPVAMQVALAVGIAVALSLAVGHTWPIFSSLFAVTVMEMICARHHRGAVKIAFGIVLGALIYAVFDPQVGAVHALTDAAIGSAAALFVALLTTPSNPIAAVHRAMDPVLGTAATHVRSIASALRSHDIGTAGSAVYALHDTDSALHRLDETLIQVRRSSVIARWHTGQDLTAATTTATEIGHAVRNIRVMARQAWWGVLRGGEQVPAALPQMLEALADGMAVLRGELAHGDVPKDARQLLISSAQWLAVMRTEPLGIAGAATAANAEAAVLNLLIATGMSVEAADAAIRT